MNRLRPLAVTVPRMAVPKIDARLDRDHLESLLALAKLHCPAHNEPVMLQTAGGQVRFWCGCMKDVPFQASEKPSVSRRLVEASP